jgi:hypothetical protein
LGKEIIKEAKEIEETSDKEIEEVLEQQEFTAPIKASNA